VDFSAGFGDALLLGFGDDLRGFAGVNGGINQCTGAYKIGSGLSFAFGGARIAYAGLAKGGSFFASSGIAASQFRNKIKNAFRFGAGKAWRKPNLSKYPTDAALRAASGKTNAPLNTYGAGVAAAGAAGCECEQ
jgi:hypothetical protein